MHKYNKHAKFIELVMSHDIILINLIISLE